MEYQKSGSGKTFVIVFLLLAMLGLGGYIVYDQVNENDKTNTLKEKITNLNNEITALKKENKTIVEKNSNNINAVYYGYSEDGSISEKEVMVLFNDGKWVYFFIDADSSSGTYEIKGNQLTIHRSATDGPSTGDSTYEISQDRNQIKTDSLTLRRVS